MVCTFLFSNCVRVSYCAFWISGNQEETAKLASIKGQLEAVQEAQKINSCVR